MSLRATSLHRAKRLLMKLRRRIYELRAFVPGLRHRHRLEALVGPLGFWDELQRYQMHTLRTRGLKPEHHLLDIGCGPLQCGVPCIRYLAANRYTGIDIKPNTIRAAHGQIAAENLGDKNPRLLLSETFGDAELNGDRFDFMWASQILCYFDEAAMGRLFGFIHKRLKPGGTFLGDIYNPDHYEFKHTEQPGKYVRHTLESIQRQADQYGLKARSLGSIGEFHYPRRLSLRTNVLIEITRAAA